MASRVERLGDLCVSSMLRAVRTLSVYPNVCEAAPWVASNMHVWAKGVPGSWSSRRTAKSISGNDFPGNQDTVSPIWTLSHRCSAPMPVGRSQRPKTVSVELANRGAVGFTGLIRKVAQVAGSSQQLDVISAPPRRRYDATVPGVTFDRKLRTSLCRLRSK